MILINSSPKDALKIFQPFLPVNVPIGVGSLLAYVRQKGIEAYFVDEQVEEDPLTMTAEYVKKIKSPYIFGFSVLTAAYKSAVILSKKLKEAYPDSVIIFGGIHPTACAEECLSHGHIDVVIRGEGERPLAQIYECVKSKKDFTRIEGLSYRKNCMVIHNPISAEPLDLDTLPDFPYSFFKSSRYDMGFVVGSRGCPYRCIFCSNRVATGKRYRYYPAKRILRDLDWIDKYYLSVNPGNRNIQFMDDNLLVSKERIYELIEQIKLKGFDKKMTFSFQARGDNVNFKLLNDLYSAGFKNIFFGLETASDRLMKMIKKDETVAQCAEAVKMAKKIGFYVSATFIFGLPTDTHAERMDCLKLSKELNLDMVRYNNATPYPGTELYEIAKREKRIQVIGLYENFNSVSAFIESPFRKIPFSYVPEGSTEKEIRNDLLYSYFAFYFDLRKIKNIFTNPDKGAGWFNAGTDFVNFFRKIPALVLLTVNISVKYLELLMNLSVKKIALVLKFKRGRSAGYGTE